jgi:hypothetical protein
MHNIVVWDERIPSQHVPVHVKQQLIMTSGKLAIYYMQVCPIHAGTAASKRLCITAQSEAN